jgi:hypothetical protein
MANRNRPPRKPRTGSTGTLTVQAAAPDVIRFTGASGPLEILAEVDNGGKKLRPFKMTAYTGAPMNVPGYMSPVVVDLAGMTVPNQRLPILRQHDPERIVAHSESIDLSPQRLNVAGVVSGTGDAATEVTNLADNGFPWQASIGAAVDRREFVDAGQTVKVNGRNWDGPLVVARASTLREVSVVPLGADPGTSAKFAAGNGGVIDMKFADWLKKNGFDPETLTANQRAALEAAYKAETETPAPPVPVVPPKGGGSIAARAEAARARERAEAHIEGRLTDALEGRRITSADFDELRAAAFLDPDKYDDNRLELEFIRRERPKGPGISFTREAQLTENVIECGLAMAGSLERIDKHYDAPVLEAARKRWRAGLSIGELALMAAQRNGFRGHSIRGNLKEVLQAAVGWGIRADAGPSTYSIPNILSNVANKFALAGFYSVDQTWGQIAARRAVNDFKQITSLRLTGNLQFLRLPPGGEIKSGDIGERVYNNQAHTFARTIGISREDWINDDTGALSGTARELGIGGGDAINNEFWTQFLNNGTFFTGGNNNVGPAGALSLQSVAAADQLFRLQTKPNGRPLGLVPSILLVPTAGRITALNLVNSTIVVATTTANQPLPSGNVLEGAYKVLSSPYLSNAAYTGNSALAFYMLAAPSQLAVIEGAFLNGVEVPTIETADFDWDQLGTSMRGYLDFGFALQEFRAGNRSPGA